MRKLLFVIPIIFGTFSAYADPDCTSDKCKTGRDNTIVGKCENKSVGNECTSDNRNAAYAECQDQKGILSCTAKKCEPGYHLWFYDTNGTGKNPMGICYSEQQAINYCHNWCTEEYKDKDCTPILDGHRTTRRHDGTTYHITDAFIGCEHHTTPPEPQDSEQNTKPDDDKPDDKKPEDKKPDDKKPSIECDDCDPKYAETVDCKVEKDADGHCIYTTTCKNGYENIQHNGTKDAYCTKKPQNNTTTIGTATAYCYTTGCYESSVFERLNPILDEHFSADKISVWKDEKGNVNTARLASDSIAGVVLGTVGGIVTSKIIKKNQIKKGFEDLKCTINGQDVASYGDEFRVGMN